ncbi:MAG: RNA helicase [Planctomycetota bacterium]|nr:MAG: RNA helicase [Planctomycetota bacterium]
MTDTWWVGEEQLDNDQKKIIGLPLGPSYLLKGPPGSGKTNLLLLRANYLSLAGHKNILVLVFTRNLQEFIAAGGSKYSFSESKIKTCRKWQQELLFEYDDLSKPNSGKFKEQRSFYLEKINQLIESKGLEDLYDAILLDEAQDYLPGEIEVFNKLSKSLFGVTDSRQKIYSGADSIELLETIVDETHPLRFHYRNGLKICNLADGIAKDSADYTKLSPTAQYNEPADPSSVEHIRCADIKEQAELIIDKLKTQRKAYPEELLGVICPRKEELQLIGDLIEDTSLWAVTTCQSSEGHISFGPDTRICICTLHSAKGLEFRALHIAGSEYIKRFSNQRNMAFTAVTRAKTSLSIYYSDNLPGYLEQALINLNPLPDLPKVNDAFGGQ